ncbi:MAG: MBL fold metallo-hydrolase [Desulfobacteraceae bacterium]|nr:MBL fold metallo-hydrolase [Desulfobacteraceae bacterium]
MKLQLIRNATMRIEYAGDVLLTDPMLSPVGAIESFAGIAPNPIVPLPMPVEEVLAGINAVLVSHLHQDHFDRHAREIIPPSMPILCPPVTEDRLREQGFKSVHPMESETQLKHITISRIGGQHGTGDVLNELGEVSGFVFRADNEPTVYWVGDSIWCEPVAAVLKDVHPDIIVVHACGAKLPGSETIVMDDDMVVTLCKHAPDTRVVAVHMEALDHATITREQLRRTAERQGVSSRQLLIPDDGDTLVFGI